MKSITLLLQIAEAEATASVVLKKPEILNEEGLPLTEIREELDEDGNVICKWTLTFINETQLSATQPALLLPQVMLPHKLLTPYVKL